MKTAVLCVLLLLAPLVGQDADVISVTPEESLEAKVKYVRLKTALQEWNDLQKAMRKKYLTVPCQSKGSGARINVRDCAREGWDFGGVFTKDFRAMVPDVKSAPSDIYTCFKVVPSCTPIDRVPF